MWINPVTQKVFRNHADIRSEFLNVSFPSTMLEKNIIDVGLIPVQTIPSPEVDPFVQVVEEEEAPILIDGQWTQQWTIRDLTPEEIQAKIPSVITMRQARLALLQEGLLDQVQSTIDSIEDPSVRASAKIEWEYATEINREHPWVQNLSSSMGISENRLNELFRLASTL